MEVMSKRVHGQSIAAISMSCETKHTYISNLSMFVRLSKLVSNLASKSGYVVLSLDLLQKLACSMNVGTVSKPLL